MIDRQEYDRLMLMKRLYLNFTMTHELNGYEANGAKMFAEYIMAQAKTYADDPKAVIHELMHGVERKP